MTDHDTLDELLYDSCEELQLPPALHDAATKHYLAVADWLAAKESSLNKYDPKIYPQGSFLIGTTTLPTSRTEFDLDFVLELALDISRSSAVGLLDAVEARLRDHGTYAPMVERLKRCVRLNYAGQFHLDILPAAPEKPPVGTRIQVPDRKLKDWKPSNPKGFGTWFGERRAYKPLEKARAPEPVPRLQSVDEKTPLQRCVQLAKRASSKFFDEAGDADSAPRSIVLTTLAGHAYAGQASTAQALNDILAELIEQANSSSSPIEVRNPAHPDEIFSEQWAKDPAIYHKYRRWLDWFTTGWTRVLTAASIQEAEEHLSILFGDKLVKSALVKHAARVEDLRKAKKLRVGRTGGLTTAAGAALIAPNTFYGED